MFELLLTLFPILVLDALNPVLFAVLVFAAGSGRPVAYSLVTLAGHTVTYFAAGLVIVYGFEQVADRLANPKRIDFVVSGIAGLLLVLAAMPTKKQGAPRADEPDGQPSAIGWFGVGAATSFVGVPFALPYFAAVGQILKAEFPVAESLGVLVAYNLLYALPFLLVPVSVALIGDAAKPLLERVNQLLTRAADFIMPWLLGLIGVALVADSIAYFFRGSGLLEFQ